MNQLLNHERLQGLELAVPGTYLIGEPVVTIAAFAQQLHVITSKQRPRKLTIHGSDGAEYMFLLKGHEDLRQARGMSTTAYPMQHAAHKAHAHTHSALCSVCHLISGGTDDNAVHTAPGMSAWGLGPLPWRARRVFLASPYS